MKRRNVELGKMRRPMKLKKATDGFYGSTLLYLKFFLLWVLVILADFILEFRFEFLWPFYLLLRSVYDSFKYQGLAFSVFFVCVALTSDMLCFFFIPVHWLFFAASTYVWVQYVWHTDKGICAPTVVLWILFVYLEAAVRLRDVKHMPGHMDLCRPFAAHCIGYPVVTLGFGFKSYVGFRMRQRKQRDVAKENEFYLQLMQQALPLDAVQLATTTTTTSSHQAATSNQTSANHHPHQHHHHHHHNHSKSSSSSSSNSSSSKATHNGHLANGVNHHAQQNGGLQHSNLASHKRKTTVVEGAAGRVKDQMEKANGALVGAAVQQQFTAEEPSPEQQQQQQPLPEQPPVAVVATANKSVNTSSKRNKEKREHHEAHEYLQKVEQDAKKLRLELQSSRASEQELRLQIVNMTTYEKVLKGDLSLLQRENEDLQCKLQSCNAGKSQDRQSISNLERRLAEERRLRMNAESQVSQERKNRKQEEQRAAMAQAAAVAQHAQCTEMCKQRRRDYESELANLRAQHSWAEEKVARCERENAALGDKLRKSEMFAATLNAIKEQNQHLENSLSDETRIKLDLFSALGEAKRQLELKDSCIRKQEKEIDELKSKIAQVLAVMPNDSFGSPTPSSAISRVRLSAVSTAPSTVAPPDHPSPGSTLDPNATAYTPKGSLVASTEA